MSDTPKSQWVIDRNYFTVKPVDSFRIKYLDWLEEYDPEFQRTVEMNEFINRISKNDFIQVYEYPHESPIKDYFEISDDNHVLPRHLFNLV